MSEELNFQTQLLRLIGESCVTLQHLVDQTERLPRAVSKAMCRLIARELVERLEVGCFQITAKGQAAIASGAVLKSGPRGPHSGRRIAVRDTLRQRAWNAMRLARRFTVRDIAMVSARGGERDPVENISAYFYALQRGGYLQKVGVEPGTSITSNGFARYALIIDTGHRAPVYSAKHRKILDYNTGGDVPCK